MPPSQLKQLKASLREHGFVGPQKSKKQKKATSKDVDKRLQRNAALEGIRERFNPFEVKAPARRNKFEVTSNKVTKTGPGRPGVTKGLGEERRRETLLKEIHRRKKVGGIQDRRFGENDPTMTPEQRAAERFARQSERTAKKSNMFNLGDEEEGGGVSLTHAGKSLDFGDGGANDDFEDSDLEMSEGDDVDDIDDRPTKRMRLDEADATGGEGTDRWPERKKTKKEVMEEIIKKSKLHKYERQQAKEDDDDLRAELNAGMTEFYEAMCEQKVPAKALLPSPPTDVEPVMNPDRAAMLAGKDRDAAEKEYNERLRQMAMDARSKPSDRTKTEDEKAAEEAKRLQDLERKRLQRMKGVPDDSDDEKDGDDGADEDVEQDDAEAFGLVQVAPPPRKELDVEDEDDFVLDDDLIASDSDAEVASNFEDESDEELVEEDGDDDFINGLVLPETGSDNADSSDKTAAAQVNDHLAFTYSCPQTHAELLEIVKDSNLADLPTIVQRIRALYHAGLAEGNKAKLANFAVALTAHIAYLADQENPPPMAVVESLIRHLHSMAKSQPEAVGSAFRSRLREMSEHRSLSLTSGDLVILTAISTIFPTSDHFHTVVTPAMIIIARYLGQSSIQRPTDLVVGLYCSTLALQYQRLSQRYVPEVITYVTTALVVLAPVEAPHSIVKSAHWTIPQRVPYRCPAIANMDPRKVAFSDLYGLADIDGLPVHLLNAFILLLEHAASLWNSKTAFNEIFNAPMLALDHVASPDSARHISSTTHTNWTTAYNKIQVLRKAAVEQRKPLLLHNHRPLAIKQSIPKFEEGFNPDRHYDPDRERSELNKLKAEHKRERKGAMRELRKDANFIARESLREKKEKDAAYEKKFKRLVAEIQGEEGRESKQYEKEKAKRKGNW